MTWPNTSGRYPGSTSSCTPPPHDDDMDELPPGPADVAREGGVGTTQYARSDAQIGEYNKTPFWAPGGHTHQPPSTVALCDDSTMYSFSSNLRCRPNGGGVIVLRLLRCRCCCLLLALSSSWSPSSLSKSGETCITYACACTCNVSNQRFSSTPSSFAQRGCELPGPAVGLHQLHRRRRTKPSWPSGAS